MEEHPALTGRLRDRSPYGTFFLFVQHMLPSETSASDKSSTENHKSFSSMFDKIVRCKHEMQICQMMIVGCSLFVDRLTHSSSIPWPEQSTTALDSIDSNTKFAKLSLEALTKLQTDHFATRTDETWLFATSRMCDIMLFLLGCYSMKNMVEESAKYLDDIRFLLAEIPTVSMVLARQKFFSERMIQLVTNAQTTTTVDSPPVETVTTTTPKPEHFVTTSCIILPTGPAKASYPTAPMTRDYVSLCNLFAQRKGLQPPDKDFPKYHHTQDKKTMLWTTTMTMYENSCTVQNSRNKQFGKQSAAQLMYSVLCEE